MVYGYVRVSTDKQTTENQRFEIEKFTKSRNMRIDRWVDETISGTKVIADRQLGKLLKQIRKGDILITTELSRLGRNLMQVMSFLHQCMERDIIVFTVKDEYKDQVEDIGGQIVEYPAALSISYTTSTADQVERMLGTLDVVIIVLIVSAGMLAFVVLYNLNNINITERQRELATLKVLGFYDLEVSEYVLRENVLLTIGGILFGCGFGVLLHRFVIVTVEVDAVMFGREIHPVSFLYCALITGAFAAVVNIFMHLKMKKIDMVESLKSVE